MMESLEALQEQARTIAEKIGEIEYAERRKTNGVKIGKTFKTQNSYSCPEKPSDYWWVYAEVTRMDDMGMLYTREFQIDKNGDIFVRFDHYAYHMQGWQPIPKAEFNRAWGKLRSQLDAAHPRI